MKILFTGATGVLGRVALPMLAADGHEVTAAIRPGSNRPAPAGTTVQHVDLFDPEAVRRAVAGHDAVIHYATAIPSGEVMAKREAWRLNDRLRSEATRLLVDAAIETGVETFIQESVSFLYADGGDRWLDEHSPVRTVWEVLDSAVHAEGHVARFTAAGGRGMALRMSRLYGPGDVSHGFLEAVGARSVPIVGGGDNFVSYLHVDDAGSATVAALRAAAAGVFNVSDHMPIRAGHDLRLVASLLGAPEPRRVPYPAARMAGKAARMLSVSHRVSAARFRDVTGWTPVHSSVEDGWPAVVAARVAVSER